MGCSPRRKIPLLGIAHPVVGKYFQVLEVHREMKHIKILVVKKAKLWLIHVFCKILDNYLVFVKFWIVYLVLYMKTRSFVIKTCLDLFNNVLESFPKFYTACITCIEVIVLN